MSLKRIPTILASGATVAAAAAAFIFAAPVHAQSYNDRDYDYEASTLGDVTVTAPRHAGRDPATGAPYEWVSSSRVVYAGDLDLNTRWGVHELRSRVEQAAASACDELENMHPVAADDSPPCVSRAVHRAMRTALMGGDSYYASR